MSNGDPDFWVQAEYAFMLTVLEFAKRESEFTQNGVAGLEGAREKIRKRKLPDEPRVRAAVTAEREGVLGLIMGALQLPASADPLERAWIAVSQRAQDWTEKHP